MWRCHSSGLDRSVNCTSFVYAWPESSGTAAEDCRREGCIRHWRTMTVRSHMPAGPGCQRGRKGGVDEVRLRVRLRVRWSLRAISAQILVHHPIKLFFLSRGGWGGSTSGSASGSLGIASNFRTKAGASSPANRFFVDEGLGKFDFGFRFGFGGRSEQCLYKARCIIPANLFFLRGGSGRFDFGFGRGSL